MEVDDNSTIKCHPCAHFAIEEAVENALKHNNSDTTVTVRTERRDDEVKIDVVDNGSGIASLETESLWTLEESQLTHGQGLGLQVIYWVTEGAGASLTIADREPRGTIVTMRFPIVTDGPLEASLDIVRNQLHS